jgi:hypothetical protein
MCSDANPNYSSFDDTYAEVGVLRRSELCIGEFTRDAIPNFATMKPEEKLGLHLWLVWIASEVIRLPLRRC